MKRTVRMWEQPPPAVQSSAARQALQGQYVLCAATQSLEPATATKLECSVKHKAPNKPQTSLPKLQSIASHALALPMPQKQSIATQQSIAQPRHENSASEIHQCDRLG